MRISTVIPSYNRADLIGETLRSVLSQTRPPAEVIVVDDGSTDGTPDVISEQFGKDVTLIRQQNAGAGPARNAGFARSTGEIIHFMDSDDLSSLNTYEVQAAAIEQGAEMVYGPWLKTRFDGTRLSPETFVLQQHPVPDDGKLALRTIMTRWVTVFQPCLFSRALIKRVGPYRSDLKPSEDSEMLYRLTNATRKLAHTPETIVLYRVHPENQVSEQNADKRRVDLANLWTLFQGYTKDHPEMSVWRRNLFTLMKLRVANEVRAIDPDKAKALEVGVTPLHRAALPLFLFNQRAIAKLRVMRTGKSYPPIFGLGRLSDTQRSEIEKLGYTIAEKP